MIDARWLERLQEWQQGKPRRSVKIEIGEPRDSNYMRVWAFDYDLMEGESVVWPNIPDIEYLAERKELAKLKELQVKYATQ